MNFYQINYLSKNILDKTFKIIKDPRNFQLYFNEYLKDYLTHSKIDNYIISYPKSGRTWLYSILKLYSIKIDFKNRVNNRKLIKFNDIFIKFVHDFSDPSPYPTKSLEFKNKDLYNKKKILLLRDPREIISSHWNHLSFREKTYNKSISEFINDEYLGIKKIIFFYNFLNSKKIDNFQIITYENLVKNPLKEVIKILNFLNLKIDENLIIECIEDCSFDKLQNKEIKEMKNKNLRALKFRKGIVGNFSKELSQENILEINKNIKINLNINFKQILNLSDL